MQSSTPFLMDENQRSRPWITPALSKEVKIEFGSLKLSPIFLYMLTFSKNIQDLKFHINYALNKRCLSTAR